MGTRDPEQPPLWIATSELPVSPGHPFYTRLNALLDAAGFDAWVKDAELSPRTFWTFAREFSPFKAARGGWWTATQIPDTILPVHSYDHAVRCSRQSPPDAHPRGSP